MTQIDIKQNIHKHRTQNFRRISPFGITPVEKSLVTTAHSTAQKYMFLTRNIKVITGN